MHFTISGFQALDYARADGRNVRRARADAGRWPDAFVYEAIDVTPDDAYAQLCDTRGNVFRPEHYTIVGTVGERAYSAAGPISIDWRALHCAAILVDMARRSFWRPRDAMGRERALKSTIGNVPPFDAFGGSYFGRNYEPLGLAGVVKLYTAADIIRHDCWDTIHAARDQEDPVHDARAGIRTAIALHELYTMFDRIGIIAYNPAGEICAVHDGALNVTGVRWVRGETSDPGPLPMSEALSFLEG